MLNITRSTTFVKLKNILKIYLKLYAKYIDLFMIQSDILFFSSIFKRIPCIECILKYFYIYLQFVLIKI